MTITSLKTGAVYDSTLLAGNAAFDPAATFLIQRIAGTGSSATISFTSIPQNYSSLQIRFIGRVTNADTGENLFLQFNSDTASNYSWHYFEGDGATVTAGGAATQAKSLSGRLSAASATSGIMGAGIIDIHNYASTTQNKTIRVFTGLDRNGSGNMRLDSGNWRSTSAITSIQITNGSSTNFTTDSTFALYGMV
jgi:hypothetical protein